MSVARKFVIPKHVTCLKEVRNLKNFSEKDFLFDLSQIPWEMILTFTDPNICWLIWKSFFLETLNKHAPLRHII